MQSGYSDVYAWMGTQQQLPDACACDAGAFAVDNGAGLSWPVNVAPGQTVTIVHETFFSPVGRGPITQSLVNSVPDPTQITLDPVVVVQSVALTAGVIVLVPFPSALFNNTLEENYAEVMGWVARLSAAANRLWGRLVAWIRKQIADRRTKTPTPPTSPIEQPSGHPLSAGPVPQESVATAATSAAVAAPAGQSPTAAPADPWRSAVRIGGFI